ncbi:unnamed protein product [Anisakis simplex]|uniref:N-terminal Ras-GEF domain-containing protein n=1 Tax=Anisakis simplex TaxID=6269 RepID=A0A0M3KG72_ANISI|nr:unnamed protein product [Anisakis simplex]
MVISGSAEALIRRLMPTHDYCPDRSYIFTLLLNIRTFVSPGELLHKVLQVSISTEIHSPHFTAEVNFELTTAFQNFNYYGRVFSVAPGAQLIIMGLSWFAKLQLQHCMFEQNATGENFTKEGRTRMFANIFKLCSEWTQNMPYDFREKPMRHRLSELLGLCSVDERSKLLTEKLFTELQSTVRVSL